MRLMYRKSVAAFIIASLMGLLLQSPAFAGAPGAPTSLTATPGNQQVALTWTAPVSTGGGGGIDHYIVEYSGDSGITYNTVVRSNSTVLSYTVTGLTNGTSYYFKVSARNADTSVGPASSEVMSTPVASFSPQNLPKYSACPTASIPSAGFSDTSLAEVNCIAYYGITKGTTATTYSPLDTVTRWQMALFLTRMATRTGVTLGNGANQGFSDISGYSSEIQTAINQIKQLGITVGKTATTYAPGDTVTREEMALFITRFLKKAVVGPGGHEEYINVYASTGPKEIKSLSTNFNFTDINRGTFEVRDAIINLWNLGVTDRQTSSTFEPTNPINRKAMAIFMANALAHTNARPKGLVLQSTSYRLPNGNSPTMSVTYRADDFSAIANARVDTFSYIHSLLAASHRFDAGSNILVVGQCSTYISATVASGTARCTVDSADRVTDSKGNLATFVVVTPVVNKIDIWAWTSPYVNTVYDNDIHAATASKVTVETHA